jgi:CHAD domain-containing protein
MRYYGTNVSPGAVNGHSTAATRNLAAGLGPNTIKLLALALRKKWKCYREHLSRCQRKLSEQAVHDLRVEARRLLSLLDLLEPFLAPARLTKAQSALKCQLDTFDDLRDAQVLLMAVGKLRKRFAAARRFHRFLEKREARLVRSTRKSVNRLQDKPLGKLIDLCWSDLKHWRKGGDSRQANQSILRTVARAFFLTKKLKDRVDPEDPHSIHCTRIAFKKFRYVTEALASHLAWVNEPFLAGMRHYQTLMGDVQDADVLLRAFEKFLNKKKTETHSARRFEHELCRRRDRLIEIYLGEAGQLLDFWPRAGVSSSMKASRNQHQKRPAARRAAAAPATLKRQLQ